VLLFVNSVDSGVRLRLFLEAFGVRTALLNAELPANSRSHILAAFNSGAFDFLIATDDVYAPTHDTGAEPVQPDFAPTTHCEAPPLLGPGLMVCARSASAPEADPCGTQLSECLHEEAPCAHVRRRQAGR
jgi:superfamily II DNA/RNA helicase